MERGYPNEDNDGRGAFRPPAHWSTPSGKRRAAIPPPPPEPEPEPVPVPAPEPEPALDPDIYGCSSRDCETGGGSSRGLIRERCELSLDHFVLCMDFLPLRWFMMLMCTCKSFQHLKQLESFDDVARKRMLYTFPKGDTIRRIFSPCLPQMSFADLQRMYVEFFFGTATELNLFSCRGVDVFVRWHCAELADNRRFQFNLPKDLTVLRKGGYFSSFYSRLRFNRFLLGRIRDEMLYLMTFIVSFYFLPADELYSRASFTLKVIIRLEFLLRLSTSSYAISKFPIYSEFWQTTAMHDVVSLPQRDEQFHIDIAERHVLQLSQVFDAAIAAPDRDNLAEILTVACDERQLTWILHLLRRALLVGQDMSCGFRYRMDPSVMPPDWHAAPLQVNYVQDSPSRRDEFWAMVMKMCIRSRNWGVFDPDVNFYLEVGEWWESQVYWQIDFERWCHALDNAAQATPPQSPDSERDRTTSPDGMPARDLGFGMDF
jgi:hypothetical protein